MMGAGGYSVYTVATSRNTGDCVFSISNSNDIIDVQVHLIKTFDLRHTGTSDTLTNHGVTVQPGVDVNFIVQENRTLPPQYRWSVDTDWALGAFRVTPEPEYIQDIPEDGRIMMGAGGHSVYTISTIGGMGRL